MTSSENYVISLAVANEKWPKLYSLLKITFDNWDTNHFTSIWLAITSCEPL